jgi:integrase
MARERLEPSLYYEGRNTTRREERPAAVSEDFSFGRAAKMRLHDLRHSAVAILLAQGVHIKAISDLLGHSSVAFTLQVYGHLLEETKREAALKMDEALNPVAVMKAVNRPVQRTRQSISA